MRGSRRATPDWTTRPCYAGFLALAVVLFCVSLERHDGPHRSSAAANSAIPTTAPPRPLSDSEIESIRDRLERAEKELSEQTRGARAAVVAFLEARSLGCRPLAEEVLSLRGKITYLWLTEEQYAIHIAERFASHVFYEAELRATVEAVSEQCLLELIRIEDRLLIDLRADLADFPLVGLQAVPPSSPLVRNAHQAIASSCDEFSGRSLQLDLATVVVAEIAWILARQVMAAVSNRLLAPVACVELGAAGGWWGIGLGTITAVSLDLLVELLLDVEGDLAEGLAESLRTLGLELGDELSLRLQSLGTSRFSTLKAALEEHLEIPQGRLGG